MNVSTVVIVVVIVFGFWELWSALNPGPGGAGYGFLFAALFIGGGLYGLRQMQTDFADTVVSRRRRRDKAERRASRSGGRSCRSGSPGRSTGSATGGSR